VGSAVLTNAVATTVSQSAPTLNLDAKTGLGVRTGGSGDAIGYIYWPRPFPLKATIISAQIVFYTAAMVETGTHTFTFQRLGIAFSASKVTWNTRPLTLIAGTKTVTRTGAQPTAQQWTLDVTDWMQSISNGGAWYGVKFQVGDNIARYWYAENNPATDLRPRLEVTWSDAPATPSGLAPSGGRKVGVSRPVVRAAYVDVSGSTQLQAINVQANATDVWTAPSFDSGTVLTSVPELDLSTTSFSALADGASIFWRVRLQDAAGLWSAWSASTSFSYDIKGTLVLNSPGLNGAGPALKVEDATPPVLWTFTGETQAAYQIQITHVANTALITDWDSGKLTSTVTSITVPSGKINEPSGTVYTIRLRVWDNKQREATPGDPVYVEVIGVFTFVPGATAPVTSMAATSGDPRPQAVLTWNRSAAPDRFNVLRNGKVIAAALDPADLFITGTQYGYTDPSPSPQRSLVYSVQAVVNNVASGTNPTATVTVRSKGIWLRELVSGLEVCIVGKDDNRAFTLGEASATLQSIAQNANKVAINQSLGGLEGRIEGNLESVYGRTAQQWRDDLLKMRALRVKRFWLTVGDYTFSVVAQNFSYGYQPTPTARFRVGFDFYQQDAISSTYLGA
jgi:hypothetical protein